MRPKRLNSAQHITTSLDIRRTDVGGGGTLRPHEGQAGHVHRQDLSEQIQPVRLHVQPLQVGRRQVAVALAVAGRAHDHVGLDHFDLGFFALTLRVFVAQATLQQLNDFAPHCIDPPTLRSQRLGALEVRGDDSRSIVKIGYHIRTWGEVTPVAELSLEERFDQTECGAHRQAESAGGSVDGGIRCRATGRGRVRQRV